MTMVYSQWKQRLYAFLLRRILGPYLSPASNRKLHDSVEVSIQEGRFALKNVTLNEDYLNSLLSRGLLDSSEHSPVRIAVRQARIRRLVIHLSLEEADASGSGRRDAASSTSSKSSVAWRAMQLGRGQNDSTTSPSTRVSLVAHVEIDGISIEVEPDVYNRSDIPREQVAPPQDLDIKSKSSGGMMSSYLDAAMSSLRLSVQMSDCCLRFIGLSKESATSWVEFRLASAYYHNVEVRSDTPVATSTGRTDSTSETVFHKTIDFAGIAIHSGSESAGCQAKGEHDSVFGRTEGTGQIILRATAYSELVTAPSLSSTTSSADTAAECPKDSIAHKVVQDIEVSLNQHFNLAVDENSLCQVAAVMRSFKLQQTEASGFTGTEKDDQNAPVAASQAAGLGKIGEDEAKEFSDVRAVSGMMKQYFEARKLAETHQLRGGILVPSGAFEDPGETPDDNGQPVTFDAFFDANDQSFYHYKSVLEESIMESKAVDDAKDDFIHTRVKFHLLGGGVKVCFRPSRERELIRNRGSSTCSTHDEYVLATFGDIDVSSSLSNITSELTMSISHVEIEDSVLKRHSSLSNGVVREGSVEIGTVLRFVEGDTDRDMSGNDIVSQAPCVSLYIRSSRGTSVSQKSINVDVELEPLDVVYRQCTVDGLIDLAEYLNANVGVGVDATETPAKVEALDGCEEQKVSVRVSCSCPFVNLSSPVLDDEFDAVGNIILPTQRYEETFWRCGYPLQNAPVTTNATVGTVFHHVSFDLVNEPQDQDDASRDDTHTEYASFSCDHVVLFVTYPSVSRSGVVSGMKRMDVVAFPGKVEVEPHVPVSVKYRNVMTPQNDSSSLGRRVFPVVPALSAFKARQDDEEKEIEDMYKSIASSARMHELQDMETVSRLRGSDPQSSMMSDAAKCTSVVELHIPEIVGDLTQNEAHVLLQMLLTTTKKKSTRVLKKAGIPVDENRPSSSAVAPGPQRLYGIAISCNQVCLNLHEWPSPSSNVPNEDAIGSSFSLVGGEWRAHAVVGVALLKHFRFLANEISLFEVHNLGGRGAGASVSDSIRERCNRVRMRNRRNSSTSAVPIIYKSQMFSPISPDSPAILVDIVSPIPCGTSAGVPCKEWNVFFTAYNITYRYDIDSSWLEHLTRVVKGEKDLDDETDVTTELSATSTHEDCTLDHDGPDDEVSLTRLFVSFADCNIDYTSSEHFHSPSRTIVRFGDVRLSSNVVSPAGEIQAYRVSVNDVSVHLSNARSPYNSESSRVTGAKLLMSPEDLTSDPHLETSFQLSPETALQKLNFITVATLDSMDALLAVSNTNSEDQLPWDASSKNEPKITASVTVGHLYLYACRDSFACLMDTVSEWQLKVTALTAEQVEILKEKSTVQPDISSAERFFDPMSEIETESNGVQSEEVDLSSQLKDMNLLSKPLTDVNIDDIAPRLLSESNASVASDIPQASFRSSQEFLLDGYDWTTVDSEWTRSGDMRPGEEQSARWYSSTASSTHDEGSSADELRAGDGSHLQGTDEQSSSAQHVKIFPQHIPLTPVADTFFHGDMDAKKLAGTSQSPPVQARVLVRDFSLRCRFFDGYDWPKSARTAGRRAGNNQDFVIASRTVTRKSQNQADDDFENRETNEQSQRKAKLMGALLDEEAFDGDGKKAFNDLPLPEEKGLILETLSENRRLARRSNRFFQVSLTGVKLRLDNFEESSAHRLASCIHLTVADLFLAETVSSSKPVKMIGEWVNDVEHPRDTNDGLIMMKMGSWHPEKRVSEDNEIVPLQSRVLLELLPIRVLLDQRALRFVAAFFSGEDKAKNEASCEVNGTIHEMWTVPPPFFRSFKVKKCKLKVDYRPEKMDVDSLREGSYVELINLSPLNDMVITLQPESIRGHIGFGPVVKNLLSLWIADVCSSQLYKFLTNAAPFQPISNVGGGVADFVVLPWEALKKGDSFSTAVKSGASSLAGTVAYETLNTTAKLTKYAAEKLASLSTETMASQSASIPNLLPSRPQETPRGVPFTTSHAVESMAHGLSAASYKVVIIPVREYRKKGAVGAARSVVRGIPIAIMAPISGATEALSYTLLGARNQMRPDIRKEEEASLRGLHHNDF